MNYRYKITMYVIIWIALIIFGGWVGNIGINIITANNTNASYCDENNCSIGQLVFASIALSFFLVCHLTLWCCPPKCLY